ncbi:hypothetical protein BDV37DRAFT_242770 [Aspergillus pseudonomiae]|uniref:Uncharacterized protein n=1 Tax=Aspergillus pseudonomiae TaxID=1506151 RepID=A0A5N7DK90_9EURO|nr:uncharacterized protein BDV37DRAFT_242770 [Aspergillus pseudonomiae]KAE8406539.1 hypothetical protein BDV37DRAFT_242770 [Aspergillus pseudonomiae]
MGGRSDTKCQESSACCRRKSVPLAVPRLLGLERVGYEGFWCYTWGRFEIEAFFTWCLSETWVDSTDMMLSLVCFFFGL